MLTPPDLERCQAEKPGNGPFTMGGTIGDPNNGYRVRCDDAPVCIAVEKQPGPDGKTGSMSLCSDCREVMKKQLGEDFCNFIGVK